MKKIKILQAIRQGKIGGGESHVLDLVSNLDTSKYEPIVLSFTDGPMVDSLNQKGIKNPCYIHRKAISCKCMEKSKRVNRGRKD